MKNYFKKSDIILILCIILIFAAIVLFKPLQTGSSYVQIKTPKGTYIYSLSEDAVLSFEGLEGTSVIEIKNGAVSFLSSTCPNKTCISEGAISQPGAFNACLPNGISITITGGQSSDGMSM